MNTNEKEVEQKTKESKQQAMSEAHTEHKSDDNKTIHTINPFTGTAVDITPEDLEGIEKKLEADTERD
jgi:hypothetical protein